MNSVLQHPAALTVALGLVAWACMVANGYRRYWGRCLVCLVAGAAQVWLGMNITPKLAIALIVFGVATAAWQLYAVVVMVHYRHLVQYVVMATGMLGAFATTAQAAALRYSWMQDAPALLTVTVAFAVMGVWFCLYRSWRKERRIA